MTKNLLKLCLDINIWCALTLTLGGTGIIPLRDKEDAKVLETALAGKVDLLITRNFKDFITYNDTSIIIQDRHAVHYGVNHNLHIVDPGLAMQWIRGDKIPHIPPNPNHGRS